MPVTVNRKPPVGGNGNAAADWDAGANGTLGLDAPGGFAGTVFGDGLGGFLRGTRIATPAGEVAVEALRRGDLVLTHEGVVRPIRWIGERRVNARSHTEPAMVLPIHIRHDAFGPGQPRRDLWLPTTPSMSTGC
jgi:hypothetical protein